MGQIYLEFGDVDSLVELIKEAKEKADVLNDISIEKLRMVLSGKKFPIRIPIELNSITDLTVNPMIKKIFGKKMDEAARKALVALLEIE